MSFLVHPDSNLPVKFFIHEMFFDFVIKIIEICAPCAEGLKNDFLKIVSIIVLFNFNYPF